MKQIYFYPKPDETYLPFSFWLVASKEVSLHGGLCKGLSKTPMSCFLAFFFFGLLLKHHNMERQTPNTINIKTPAQAIQMMFLAIKDFLALATIGAVREEGLFATFQGDSPGDGAMATGEGAAAGGDGITLVLNGFPSFLQGTCHHVNLNTRSGNKPRH